MIMTVLSADKSTDGQISLRIQFTEGVFSMTKDCQFYQVTQAEVLNKLKEQCRQLAVSLDTVDKVKTAIGKSWNYTLATDTLTAIP